MEKLKMQGVAKTYTIQITGVPGELLRRLDERVQECGGDRSGYICEVLEKDLAEQMPHAGMTFREIFAPAQEGFDQSGMTDEELSDFIEAEVKAYRAERRAREQQGA
jgi:hypothetical protein